MKEKQVTVFICEYCGETSKKKEVILNHEYKCTENPKNIKIPDDFNELTVLNELKEQIRFDYPDLSISLNISIPYIAVKIELFAGNNKIFYDHGDTIKGRIVNLYNFWYYNNKENIKQYKRK